MESQSIHRYFNDLRRHIEDLETSQSESIQTAAQWCTEALKNKKVIHIFDTGHLVSHELIMRTGGLAAFTPLIFDGNLDNVNLWRQHNLPPANSMTVLQREQALLDWVFLQGTLQAGDVLFIGSVSGVSLRPVELALRARKEGLKIIAITAVDFSRQLPSKHPTGKRLYEAADLTLDNRAAYGDSSFQVDGFDRTICPHSGIAAAAIMWAINAGIVEELVHSGIEPSVYSSVNLPDGPQDVVEVQSRYKERGV